VRYYERIGLLQPAARTSAGYRQYDAVAVDRLRFIRGVQLLGLTLQEIGDLLTVRDTGECPCGPAETLLRQHVQSIDAETARLDALRAELIRMADQLPGPDCAEPTPGSWRPPQDQEGRCHPMNTDDSCPCCDDPTCDGSCCGDCC
jgi:DNA-binding transcriptional MerR regulator